MLIYYNFPWRQLHRWRQSCKCWCGLHLRCRVVVVDVDLFFTFSGKPFRNQRNKSENMHDLKSDFGLFSCFLFVYASERASIHTIFFLLFVIQNRTTGSTPNSQNFRFIQIKTYFGFCGLPFFLLLSIFFSIYHKL